LAAEELLPAGAAFGKEKGNKAAQVFGAGVEIARGKNPELKHRRVDFAEATANVPKRDQGAPNEQCACFHINESKRIPSEKQRFALSINPGPKHNPQTENHELDPPLHGSHCRSECSFQIHEDQHSSDEEKAIQRLRRSMKANPPTFARFAVRQNRG